MQDRTENVELCVLCLIYKDNKILLQNRIKEDWMGYTLPGGHVEIGESFIDAVVREMKEETGLTIMNPKLCGIKHFPITNGRYVVLLFKTNEFEGVVSSSNEGKMEWIDRSVINDYRLVEDFKELLNIIDDDKLTEFQYSVYGEKWEVNIR